jgi:hypothetical protein
MSNSDTNTSPDAPQQLENVVEPEDELNQPIGQVKDGGNDQELKVPRLFLGRRNDRSTAWAVSFAVEFV